jgi:hypothetical protein
MKNKIKQGFYVTEVRYGLAIIEVEKLKDGYIVEIEFDNCMTRLRSISDKNFTEFAKTKELLENSERSVYLGKP